MIENKLKKARLHTAKRRIQLGVGLFIAVCLCSLLVIGLSFYDFSKKPSALVVEPPKEILPENGIEKIREEFIAILQHYENEIESRLESMNAELWSRDLFEINELKKQAMLNYSNGDYPIALYNLKLLRSLTKKVLEESDHRFEENFEKAVLYLSEDLYNEARFHVEKALLINPAKFFFRKIYYIINMFFI